MQRRKGRSPGEPVETDDPHSLTAHIGRHLAWLEARGYAVNGLWTRRADLKEFCGWCAEREVVRPPDLNRIVIDLFQRYISQRPKKDGDPLSATTQCKKLMTIAKYCKWLVRERLIAYDPAAELELPRPGIRLPKAVLTADEAEDVLAVPDVSSVLGLEGSHHSRSLLRDRHSPVGAHPPQPRTCRIQPRRALDPSRQRRQRPLRAAR